MSPHELSFQWVYIPPALFTVGIGFALTLIVAWFMNRSGVVRHFWHPGLSFVAIWVLMTSLVGLLYLPP